MSVENAEAKLSWKWRVPGAPNLRAALSLGLGGSFPGGPSVLSSYMLGGRLGEKEKRGNGCE